MRASVLCAVQCFDAGGWLGGRKNVSHQNLCYTNVEVLFENRGEESPQGGHWLTQFIWKKLILNGSNSTNGSSMLHNCMPYEYPFFVDGHIHLTEGW